MRRRLVPVLVVVVVATVLVVAVRLRVRHATAPPASAGRLLVHLPKTYGAATLSISEDGKDYAFVSETSGRCHVVQRNRKGPEFAKCSVTQFAPASHAVFYWAVESIPLYQRLFHWIRHLRPAPEPGPVLIANGQVVVTGAAHPAPIIFSVVGTRWGIAAKTPDREVDGKTVPGPVALFADGRDFGRFKDASHPAFSRDGKHLAYLIENDDGQVKLIVDGTERRSFEKPSVTVPEITQGASGAELTQRLRVIYLYDGTLLVLAPGHDGWVVYHDDQPLAAYAHNVAVPQPGVGIRFGGVVETSTAIFARSLSSAAKAPVTTWWERPEGSEERWQVVRNGTPDTITCARYWKNEPPLLSSDGQHLAYPCYLHSEDQGEDIMVVTDGKQFGPYQNAGALIFSDDGTHLAYSTSDGSERYDWSYHVDGKDYPQKFEQVWPPRFNPTGTHVAWEAQRGKRPVLFLDGREVRSFDDVLWGPVFSPTDTVSWVIRRGRRVLRVEVPVTQGEVMGDE